MRYVDFGPGDVLISASVLRNGEVEPRSGNGNPCLGIGKVTTEPRNGSARADDSLTRRLLSVKVELRPSRVKGYKCPVRILARHNG